MVGMILVLIASHFANKDNKKFKMPDGIKVKIRILPPPNLQSDVFYTKDKDISVRMHLEKWTELHQQAVVKNITESLEKQLEEAVLKEDYLLAAKIRDEIKTQQTTQLKTT
jgi:excinuclease UvrABC helicase subunit UvrB